MWRVLGFGLVQALAVLIGWWLALAWGALLSVALVGLGWVLWDSAMGTRTLQWLSLGECRVPPVRLGLWGDVAARVVRLLQDEKNETKRSDARLQDFLLALQASPNGVVLLDDQGHIEWCNQTASILLGFQLERDKGQLIGYLVRDPSFTAYFAALDFSHEVVFAGAKSTFTRPVTVSLQIHPYSEGRKLLLCRDITALEQADAMRRDFVANVSHEIRTPLTVLCGFVETLQTLPLGPEEQTKYLDLMASQAHRMQMLVGDLLTLSRLEGSALPGFDQWTSLRTLIARCQAQATALSATLGEGGMCAHSLDLGRVPPLEVAGIASELQSAFSNLLDNAVRYTPVGGRIVVRWAWIGDPGSAPGFASIPRSLQCTVRDNGVGIASEHLPRLTERFYRVDTSRSRQTGGTGLGLAIVKHVLQRHGATLAINSTLGQGSCFTVVLPANRLRDAERS